MIKFILPILLLPLVGFAQATEPLANLQWGLKNTGQVIYQPLTDIQSEKIEPIVGTDVGLGKMSQSLRINKPAVNAKPVVVAVIDFGISIEHNDLKESLFVNSADCDSDGAIPFKPEEDKDNNGFKGDCIGWNFSGKGDENRPFDDSGHGTHVSSIIAGRINNDGVEGVAPQVKILPIKVTYPNDFGVGLASRVEKALQFALLKKVDVINLSLGWPGVSHTAGVEKALKDVLNAGIVVVAAAGNNSSFKPIYPCALEGVVCVGGIVPSGKISLSSNRGAHVDLLAPGVQILGAIPETIKPTQYSLTGFDYKTGTSQAAPFVSGAVALLKMKFPNASSSELKARLLLSARNSLDSTLSTQGLVQIEKALSLKEQVILSPSFKGDGTVLVDPNTNRFEISVPLENLWKASDSGLISMSTNQKTVDLDVKELKLEQLKSGEKTLVKFKGKLSDLEGDQAIAFNLEIKTPTFSRSYTFQKTFVLPYSDQTAEKLSLDLSSYGIPLTEQVGLNSISSLGGDNSKLQYYFTRFLPDEKKSTLSVLSINSNKTIDLKSMDLIGDESLAEILKLSIPNSPINFILATNVADPDNDGALIYRFRYLDSNLKSILPIPALEYSTAKYGNEVAVDFNKTEWIPAVFQNVQIKVPAFLFKARVSDLDRNNNPLEETTDFTSRTRAFILQTGSDKNLTLRTLDSEKLMKPLVSALNVKFNERVLIRSLMNSRDGRALAEVIGPNVRNAIVDFKSNGTITNIVSVSSSIQGFQAIPSAPESGAELLENYPMYRVQSANLIEFILLDKKGNIKSFSYNHPYLGDDLIRVVVGSADQKGFQVFLETKTKIVLLNSKGFGPLKAQYYPIHRSSLLNSRTFSDLFSPIKMPNGDLSLFVDSSALYKGQASLLMQTLNGLLSKVENSMRIEATCELLTPQKINDVVFLISFCSVDSSRELFLRKID